MGSKGKRRIYSLKRTPKTGIVVYATMGKINTKPVVSGVRVRNNHGITTRITKEMEEKRYEY